MNPGRVLAPLLAFALFQSASAMAEEGDDVLFKACPGLQEWQAAHPHKDHPGEDAKPTRPELRVELQKRVDADQKARAGLFDASGHINPKAWQKVSPVDRANVNWLKQLVAAQGFPTVEQVGADGVSNAFILVQHADTDTGFQASMLAAIEPHVASGEFRKSEFAMLTDRVLASQGRMQRYGSQYDIQKDGSLKMKPTEDPAHLAERRAAMDLLPTALYECAMRASLQQSPPRME